MKLVTSRGQEECDQFFRDFISPHRSVLFISTLGFSDLCLYFPQLLASYSNIDYLFLVERRPEVSEIIQSAADRNRDVLNALLAGRNLWFREVEVVADDTANIAGRNAARVCSAVSNRGYTDVFVDATTMSRGVCFPIVKQAHEMTKSLSRNAHVLVAGRPLEPLNATSMSSDAPQYIHGFQADMDTDNVRDAIKLWIPQLSEGSIASLMRMHKILEPHETCPILPFPADNPRRGDQLLRIFQQPILNDWDVNLLDVIYAQESDPTDVCETITRIHNGRKTAFENSTKRPARTVLSPAGTRIGSVGMLLATLRLDLPIMYEESIGYVSDLSSLPVLLDTPPSHLWHVWLKS